MKKLFVYLALAMAAAVAVGLYFYLKKPADVRTMEPDFTMTASELVALYADEQKGNEMLVGKTIQVSGTVATVEPQTDGGWTIVLSTEDPLAGVTCSFYLDEAPSVKVVQPGQEVTIKGSCTGKIMDVVLNHCSLIK